MNNLAIATTTMPALHQSTFELMRCPTAYAAWREGKRTPSSLESARGTEIHHVMATYADHCVSQRVGADWEYFDQLTIAAGDEAGPILESMRDSHIVDWKHIYGTEMTLALDEDLAPVRVPKICEEGNWSPSFHDAIPGLVYTDADPAHAGTLDVLSLFEDNTAVIDDYKSHPQPFDPETYQGMLYPFMVFKHFPHIQRVTFRLRFVRYPNVVRENAWTRDQMPDMERTIRQARGRQQSIELKILNNQPLDAFPHAGCHYCPLATNFTCPIAEFNPEINLSMVERAKFARWYSILSKPNNAVLKNHVQATGRGIDLIDGTGQLYTYDAQESAKKVYPLDRTLIRILDDYSEASGEDWPAMKLAISSTSLSPKLKTKKRSALRETIEASHLEMKPGIKYAFAKVLSDGSRDVDEDTRDYSEDGF